MTSFACDADILIVGAGPAGVAAALMATSLRLRTVVVEAKQVGGKLHTVSTVENVPGGWSTGPQLAQALAADLERLEEDHRCTLLRTHAVAVSGHEDHAELTLDDRRTLTAQAIVVATGVATLTPADASWVTAPDGFASPPLWRTSPDTLTDRTYVLGADRPLGTWLRAYPKAPNTLHVLHPPSDDYKTDEVRDDERIRLVPVSHVTITKPTYGEGWVVEVDSRDGQRTAYAATAVLNNLGAKPAALEGLLQEEDGYCPTDRQHERIRVAGDLRSARYQRIATAQGSGAEAVLACYYATMLQPSGRGAAR
ncbi:NAD(P)/FAD-dependent oxidoreductase [Streptomyces megasporus]|uniref:NAD(P)/FAD-dependent oxidoreductase n=1 Tax=Streptomyces megasporus TaxID=44060 RepID=UPI0004E0DF28|nr:FAD-dependent oxidoreductase [Streptomyces megasporus]